MSRCERRISSDSSSLRSSSHVLRALQALECEHYLRGQALERRQDLVCQRTSALQHQLTDPVFLQGQRHRGLVLGVGDRLAARGELGRAAAGAEDEAGAYPSLLAGEGDGGLDGRVANAVVILGRGQAAHCPPQHQLAPGRPLLTESEPDQADDHESDDGGRAGDGGGNVELSGATGGLDGKQPGGCQRGCGEQRQTAWGQLLSLRSEAASPSSRMLGSSAQAASSAEVRISNDRAPGWLRRARAGARRWR